jgi:hypothetical protein
VALRRRDGAGTSDRVTLLWPDNAIRNGWLQVTVRATANTGLAAADVFAFGNLVGETGDAATPRRVSALDVVAVRRAVGSAAGATDRYDFNRDGVVDALDLAIVRRNLLNDLPAPPTA